ncbi:hypothetical protein [Streptomyces agglomeratus]|uniref:hypothetical protein n=1 Tax=Streptomyces agglomeratus TaxID=285458 RepID=UPI0008540324|nr:hypothetical protein [Streptomyces agglomeratus]OEJ51980.1 hypothetical protein BGK72_15585 [Streptomyces agglomeratus]
MTPITHTERALLLLARLRVGLAIAGVAWLLGYSPALAGRITVGVLVVLVLLLDAAAGTVREPVTVTFGRRAPGGTR